MSCQIKFDPINRVYDVTAPNGEESILFHTIKQLPEITDDYQAVRSWVKIYTKAFKEWYGVDWENLTKSEKQKLQDQGYLDQNGEPVIFFRGDYEGLESFNYSPSVGKFGQGIYLAQNKSQAEAFAAETGKKIYPVFLRPGKVVKFNNTLDFKKAVSEYNSINVLPTEEHVKNYVEGMHNNGFTIVGRGVMGLEYNIPSKSDVKSVFSQGFAVTSGLLFDNISVAKQFMTKEFQESRRADQFVDELISRLSKNLGISPSQIKMVDKDEAALITKNSKNPWAGQPAFFYNGVVHFVKGKLTYETAFHEFAHPFVRTLAKENEALYNRIFEDIIAESKGKELLAETMEEYPELDGSHPQIQEEVIVKAMTYAANNADMLDKAAQPTKGIMGAIAKLLYAIKQIIRKISGKADLKNLSEKTTFQDLAKMMVDDTWNINMDVVNEDDVVAYMKDIKNYVDDLMKFHNTEKGRAAIYQQIKENNDVAIKQMQAMKDSGQFEDLKIVLSDNTGRDSYETMRANMAALNTKDKVLRAMDNRIDELKEFEKRVQALAFNLDIIDDLVTKMKAHTTDLADEPNQKKALGQLMFYTKSLDQWETYLERFLRNAEESGISTDSELVKDIGLIKEKIKRGKTDIHKIYKNATRDTLFEMWEPLNKSVRDRAKARIQELESKREGLSPSSTTWQNIQREIDDANKEVSEYTIDKEKMLDYITGQMGDIGTFHAWLENYASNQDPSIASFAMYLKKNISDVHIQTQQGYTDFVEGLGEHIKELGVDPSKLGKFSDIFLFEDKSYKRNENTGEIEEYKVLTFLNEFKDYKYVTAQMNERIDEAEVKFEANPSEENLKEYVDAVTAKEEHMKYFFNKPYVDEYYHADDILDKSAIGRQAKQKRDAKLSEIEFFQRVHADEQDLFENFNTVDSLWREYKQLFSLYDNYGKLKTGDELEEARLLRQHRDAKSKFYKYEEIPGAFQTSYEQFKIKERLKMSSDFVEGSKEFDEEFERRRKAWLEANTRLKISPDFYVARQNIMDKIQEILSKVEGNDFTAEWEMILDSMQGRKDNDGQPIGIEMTDEHLKMIRDLEQQMEDAKAEIPGISGLSSKQWEELNSYYEKIENGEKLSPKEREAFKDLKAKKGKGLPRAEKVRLMSLFRALEQLQEKKPTDYYLEIMNEHYSTILRESGKENPEEITHENVDMFSSPAFVHDLFEKNKEFEEWFLANHIKKTRYFAESGTTETIYVRSYAWSVIRPTDEKYLEKTEIFDENGDVSETITGIPTIKYYKRRVKEEYQTGYNPKTGQVELKIGEHKDAQGNWLPKSLKEMERIKAQYADKLAEQNYAYDYYINRDYLNMDRNSPEFKTLEFLKEFHLKHQEGLEKTAKLGFELPRYRKDLYQYMTSGEAKSDVKDKWGSLVEGWSQLWSAKKDDYEDGLNFDEQMNLVNIDIYAGDTGRVPVTGRYLIESDQVSKDITSSMMNYYQSSSLNKRLRELQPIAKAMQDLARHQNPADLKSIQKMSYRQRQAKEYIPGKSNNRLKVIDSMVETMFEGKKLFDNQNNPVAIKVMNNALGMASHAFFAFDVTSAMKNFLGAQFQIALEGAGNKYFNYREWQKGRPWAYKTMWEISGQIYSQQAKSLNVQITEVFDAIQGRFEENFGENLSRSFARDAASLSWTTSHRKWLETEASLQLFAAIMKSTKLDQKQADGSTKKISYLDAWELDPDSNKIRLKEGIDKAYDLGGDKFNAVKFKNHEVSNLLQGAYAAFDQPMVNRHILWRMVSSMRKYFTKMFLHRYGMRGNLLDPKERFNLPTQDLHMGYYMRNIATLRKVLETKGNHLLYMTKDEVRALKMGLVELMKIMLISASYMWLWGFDEDDPDKWKKRKGEIDTGAFFKGSGAMPWLGLTDEEWSEGFNLQGWLGNHLLLLTMNIEAENEHFIPWPGFGLKDMTTVMSESSVASGPSILSIMTMFYDLVYTVAGEDSVYYQKDTGALNIQQEGENKFWRHLYKAIGIKGKWIDPVTATKNFKSSRDNYSSN